MPAIPGVPLPLTRNPPVEPTTKGYQEPGVQGAHALQEFRRSLTTDEFRGIVAYAYAPRRRWWIGTADHVFRHRRSRDLDDKHRQFAVDTRRAPQDILPTHVSDARARLRCDGRPSWPLLPTRPPQMVSNTLSSPTSYGVVSLLLADNDSSPVLSPRIGSIGPSSARKSGSQSLVKPGSAASEHT
jgi:hypothetical protein